PEPSRLNPWSVAPPAKNLVLRAGAAPGGQVGGFRILCTTVSARFPSGFRSNRRHPSLRRLCLADGAALKHGYDGSRRTGRGPADYESEGPGNEVAGLYGPPDDAWLRRGAAADARGAHPEK